MCFKIITGWSWERSFQHSTVLPNRNLLNRTNRCGGKSLSTQKVVVDIVAHKSWSVGQTPRALALKSAELHLLLGSLCLTARPLMFLHHQIISSVGFWVGDSGEWQLADGRAVCGHQQEGQRRQAKRPGSWWHAKLQRKMTNQLFTVCLSLIRVTLRASHPGTRFWRESRLVFTLSLSLGRLGFFVRSWHFVLACNIYQLWWEGCLPFVHLPWWRFLVWTWGRKGWQWDRRVDTRNLQLYPGLLYWLTFGNWEKKLTQI